MEEIFSYMKEQDASYPQWYELAVWADDMKGTGMNAFDSWHFYNQIYLDGIPADQCKVIVNKANSCVNTVVFSYRSLRLRNLQPTSCRMWAEISCSTSQKC